MSDWQLENEAHELSRKVDAHERLGARLRQLLGLARIRAKAADERVAVLEALVRKLLGSSPWEVMDSGDQRCGFCWAQRMFADEHAPGCLWVEGSAVLAGEAPEPVEEA